MNSQALTRVQFWAAAALIAGFFLPWISMLGFISLPGYQVSDLMRQNANKAIEFERDHAHNVQYQLYTPKEKQERDAQKAVNAQIEIAASYGLYAVPLLALMAMVIDLRVNRSAAKQLLYFLSGLLTLAVLGTIYWTENDDGKLVQQVSIGAWLAAAGGAGVTLSALWHSTNPSQNEPATAPVVASDGQGTAAK